MVSRQGNPVLAQKRSFSHCDNVGVRHVAGRSKGTIDEMTAFAHQK
jgi:hypothetical protein